MKRFTSILGVIAGAAIGAAISLGGYLAYLQLPVGSHEYYMVNHKIQHLPEIKPFVAKRMADGGLTNSEYREILREELRLEVLKVEAESK